MMFRNWVLQNFPFLEDDFDALTDYELFCEMLEYVKEFAKDNEDFNKRLTNLENYINNLDLQDEVNNKLDEMVQDGTLAKIINQQIFTDLNNQVNQNKNDITSLQNLTSNLPTDEENIQKLQKFNEYTNKPLRYSKLDISNYFPYLDFNLYRNLDGTIKSDFPFIKYETTSNILYVDRDSGNDSNDGSSQNPLKTIKGALDKITSLGSDTTYKIICKTYRFFRNEFYTGTSSIFYNLTNNVIIEPEDSSKMIDIGTDDEVLTWSQYNETSTWYTTRSSVANIFNRRYVDGYGMYKEIKKCDTLDECLSTRDSYYISGSQLYLHTENGEIPTNSRYLIALAVTAGNFNLNGNHYLRLKNLNIYSPARVALWNNDTANIESRLICENVNLWHCNNNNGFNIDNVKYVFMKNCKTGYNQRDGFNYHYTTMAQSDVEKSYVYEENCESYENGFRYTTANCNASSIHEKGNIIRVNGIYQNSFGPVIADIDSSKTLMIHSKVYQKLNTSYPFNFGNNENSGGFAILCDIECIGYNSVDIYSSDEFDVRLKNFKGNYENSNLNITLYEE